MQDRYTRILKYRMGLRNKLDLLGLVLVLLVSFFILGKELLGFDLKTLLTYQNVFSFILLFGVIGVIRYRIYSCPRCQKNLRLTQTRGQFFEPVPNYCPHCQLNLKQTLGLKNDEHIKISLFPKSISFLTILFLMSIGVYGLYLVEFFSLKDITHVILPAIGLLALILVFTFAFGMLKACKKCGMPFQTGKYCRRCGVKSVT